MIRAVIDTNVLVSGLLSPAGNEALIVLAIHQGLIRPCFSEAMMQEYAEVLARPKFSFEPDAIAAALAMFSDNGEFVVPRTVERDLPDPDDAKFVHCAETQDAQGRQQKPAAKPKSNLGLTVATTFVALTSGLLASAGLISGGHRGRTARHAA